MPAGQVGPARQGPRAPSSHLDVDLTQSTTQTQRAGWWPPGAAGGEWGHVGQRAHTSGYKMRKRGVTDPQPLPGTPHPHILSDISCHDRLVSASQGTD